jgi:hypothetical protein
MRPATAEINNMTGIANFQWGQEKIGANHKPKS